MDNFLPDYAAIFASYPTTPRPSSFTIRVERPSPSPVPAFLELVAPSGIHVESLIVNLRATGRPYDEEYRMLTHFAKALQSLTPAKYQCPNLNPVITLLPSCSATALCLQGARVEPRLLARFLMGYPRVKSFRLRNVAFLEDNPAVRPALSQCVRGRLYSWSSPSFSSATQLCSSPRYSLYTELTGTNILYNLSKGVGHLDIRYARGNVTHSLEKRGMHDRDDNEAARDQPKTFFIFSLLEGVPMHVYVPFV
ncbi:hypothetical protein BDZ89DRAFT_1149495 [Hymenopellis radicata]|nr:hypothetical protein BDZ89DRAFT_1149495 [Hymenopellis radicata]